MEQDYLKKIRESYGRLYLETSELAESYNQQYDICTLDHANDYHNHLNFTDEVEEKLARISVIAWQALATAMEIEKIKPIEHEHFGAIFNEVMISHFG